MQRHVVNAVCCTDLGVSFSQAVKPVNKGYNFMAKYAGHWLTGFGCKPVGSGDFALLIKTSVTPT